MPLALGLCHLVSVMLILFTGPLHARADLVSRSDYCFDKTCRPSNKNITWDRQISSSSESEYAKLQRRQAELCRQGKIGAPGQLQDGCSMWRFKYIDEESVSGFKVKIADKSLDERLANIIYTSLSVKALITDYFSVNGEDANEMEQNFRSLEGPQVNADQCHWQLEQMLAQLDELEARLDNKRHNSSFELALDERHIRLARAMDSYGRYEAGALLGKHQFLGSFAGCKSSRLLLPALEASDSDGDREQRDNELVKTRFCWARMDLSRHMSASLRARKKDSFEAAEHVLQVGVCLPESCHTRNFLKGHDHNKRLLQRLVDSQFKLPASLYVDESLPLQSVYCLADEQSAYKVPLSGKLALSFVGVWFLLTIYATYYHEMRRKPRLSSDKKNDDHGYDEVGGNYVDRRKWARDLLDCLNLKKSWQDFMGEKHDRAGTDSAARQQQQQQVSFARPQQIDLDTLNPIKALGCMLVVFGHAILVVLYSPTDMLGILSRFEEDPLALGTLAATLIVDTFFVISGILMGYIVMVRSAKSKRDQSAPASESSSGQTNDSSGALISDKKADSENKLATATAQTRQPEAMLFLKQWLSFVLTRYLRLVPLLFLIFWLKRSVLVYYMAYGQPLMDNGFHKETSFGACKRESWWTPFTMMAAFLPLSQQCMPQAWSIASDLFFTITVAPIVLIMTKRPRTALIVGSVAFLVSWLWAMKTHMTLPIEKEAALIHLRAHGFVGMFGETSYLYTYPHLRLGPILVGVLAGYTIHKYETTAASEHKQWYRGWPTRLSFALLPALVVFVCFLRDIMSLLAGYESYLFASILVGGRIVWTLANGIVFIRMTTDWSQAYLMRQFSSKFWLPVIKLNLAILLVHVDVLFSLASNSLVIDYFSYSNMLRLFCTAYLTCIPLAILVHVIFESPVNKLTKRYVLSVL